jgi:hypothetical protein
MRNNTYEKLKEHRTKLVAGCHHCIELVSDSPSQMATGGYGSRGFSASTSSSAGTKLELVADDSV